MTDNSHTSFNLYARYFYRR